MTRKRGHWVLGAGIACLVLAFLVGGWVLADPNPGAGDQTARTITLWLVAAKLLVGGASRCGSRRTASGTPCAEPAASVNLQSLQESCCPDGRRLTREGSDRVVDGAVNGDCRRVRA